MTYQPKLSAKSTGTSYQIEIQFPIETTKFLTKYDLLCIRIFGRHLTNFTKHDY